MKALPIILFLIVFFVADAQPFINISVQQLGNKESADIRRKSIIDKHSKNLRKIRDGMKLNLSNDSNLQHLFPPAIRALDAILDKGDVSGISDLLPVVDWLHANGSEGGGPQLTEERGNTLNGIILNYFIDDIFTTNAWIEPDNAKEDDIVTMIRFYAGNPAQTSEGSSAFNDTMLFLFGNRLVDCLATKQPDRVEAFYKAVQVARQSARSGPGPDEEAIPENERPTEAQLKRYEAAFSRLESLATKGVLPPATDFSPLFPTPTSQMPQPPKIQQQAPEKSTREGIDPKAESPPVSPVSRNIGRNISKEVLIGLASLILLLAAIFAVKKCRKAS